MVPNLDIIYDFIYISPVTFHACTGRLCRMLSALEPIDSQISAVSDSGMSTSIFACSVPGACASASSPRRQPLALDSLSSLQTVAAHSDRWHCPDASVFHYLSDVASWMTTLTLGKSVWTHRIPPLRQTIQPALATSSNSSNIPLITSLMISSSPSGRIRTVFKGGEGFKGPGPPESPGLLPCGNLCRC